MLLSAQTALVLPSGAQTPLQAPEVSLLLFVYMAKRGSGQTWDSVCPDRQITRFKYFKYFKIQPLLQHQLFL